MKTGPNILLIFFHQKIKQLKNKKKAGLAEVYKG